MPNAGRRQSGQKNHIAGYRTDKKILVRSYSRALADLLNQGSASVNKLRQKLESYSDANSRDPIGFKWAEQAAKFSELKATANTSELGDNIYYNAAYVNQIIDANDEEAKYNELKKPLPMRRDSCFGNGSVPVAWNRSDVHVPFNVYRHGVISLFPLE